MKISIIITTLGHRESLFEAIHSAVIQTYSNKEIIVVNDGLDAGLKKKINSRYPNLIYYNDGIHRGGNGARRIGAEIASGEYISFLDDDDILLPEKLSCLASAISKKKGVYVISGLTIRRSGQDLILTPKNCNKLFSLVDVKYFHTASSIIERQYALGDGILPDLLKYQDTYFYMTSILNGAVILIKKPVCIWRRNVNHDGITSFLTFNDYKKSLLSFYNMVSLLKKNNNLKNSDKFYLLWLLIKHSLSFRKILF